MARFLLTRLGLAAITLFLLIGAMLYAYHQHFPLTVALPRNDAILPRFIVDHLPHGLIASFQSTLEEARDAARELVTIADGLSSAVVRATASMAQGALQLAAGSPAAALEQLRRALNGWRELQLPYEEATARLLIGTTQRLLGDEEGGRIEVDAARAGFDRLGAAADARHAAALLRLVKGRPPGTDSQLNIR
jgi:hypothetical protein